MTAHKEREDIQGVLILIHPDAIEVRTTRSAPAKHYLWKTDTLAQTLQTAIKEIGGVAPIAVVIHDSLGKHELVTINSENEDVLGVQLREIWDKSFTEWAWSADLVGRHGDNEFIYQVNAVKESFYRAILYALGPRFHLLGLLSSFVAEKTGGLTSPHLSIISYEKSTLLFASYKGVVLLSDTIDNELTDHQVHSMVAQVKDIFHFTVKQIVTYQELQIFETLKLTYSCETQELLYRYEQAEKALLGREQWHLPKVESIGNDVVSKTVVENPEAQIEILDSAETDKEDKKNVSESVEHTVQIPSVISQKKVSEPIVSEPSTESVDEVATVVIESSLWSRMWRVLLILLTVFLLLGGAWLGYSKGYVDQLVGFFTSTTDEQVIEIVGEPLPSTTKELTQIPEPTVTPTPEEVLPDFESYQIEILNGSGIAGAAGKAEKILLDGIDETLKITLGNAEDYSYTLTEVHLKPSLPAMVESTLEDLLSDYEPLSIEQDIEEDSDIDIHIIVGAE